MTQETLLNLAIFISSFSLVGGILDKLTEKGRQTRRSDASHSSYEDILFSFYNGILERLLPGSPTSFRFIKRSIILSLFMLVSFHYTFDRARPDFINIFPENNSAALFYGALISFYAFIFWLVAAQTKLFVYESFSASSPVSRFLFVFSDVLVSTNIFVFLFALGVWSASGAYIHLALNPELQRAQTTSQVIAYNAENMTVVRIRPRVDGKNVQPTSSFHFFNYSELVIEDLKEEVFAQQFIYNLDGNWKEVGNAQGVKEHLFPWTTSSADVQLTEFSYQHPGIKHSFRHYAPAYLAVDRVEDGFWNLLDPSTTYFKMNDVLQLFVGYNPYHMGLFCTWNESGNFVFEPMRSIEGVNQDIMSCDNDARVNGYLQGPATLQNISVAPMIDFWVPLTPFFFAIMGLSILFYFAVAVAYLFTALLSVSLSSKVILNIYITAPFAATGALIGCLLWLITFQ